MTHPRIVSIGECMVEMAPRDTAGVYSQGFAGDTFNTAWYLARLCPDWAVDYVTDTGVDPLSQQLAAFLVASGVGVDHLRTHPDATLGLYLISLHNGERSFAYWRGQSAARRLADDTARLDRAFAGADLVYFSGITLGILSQAGRHTLLAAVARAREAGAKITFDSNLRPRLWADVPTMCAAVMQAAGHADIVLPSHDDEAAFFGDADPQATLDRYRGAGVEDVVVKNGGGRIVFATAQNAGHFDPSPVTTIVDSTAAGDSFNAAYLAARLSGETQHAAVARACAVSARVIGGRGALIDPALT